jgi:hypothetical protein
VIALRAASVERALADLALGSACVVRASRLEIVLPAGVTEVADAETEITALDAASLAEAIGRAAALPAGRRLVWAMPLAAPGVVGWALARARRVQPVALEDACDGLRRAGVVDVRVVRVDGALATVVISGRTTGA